MPSPEDCLPPELRRLSPAITPVAAGFSGASVYRVEAAGRTFVLKLARPEESDTDWRRTWRIQEAAGEAGLTPPILHVDESRADGPS